MRRTRGGMLVIIGRRLIVQKVGVAPCRPVVAARTVVCLTEQDVLVGARFSKRRGPIDAHRHPRREHNVRTHLAQSGTARERQHLGTECAAVRIFGARQAPAPIVRSRELPRARILSLGEGAAQMVRELAVACAHLEHPERFVALHQTRAATGDIVGQRGNHLPSNELVDAVVFAVCAECAAAHDHGARILEQLGEQLAGRRRIVRAPRGAFSGSPLAIS
eukprot:2488423-Prymnesium_polylepis.1